MAEKKSLSFIVEGGKATGGPPIGPALGPLGLNVMQVVKAINEKTAEFSGMKVPVKVIVDPETKEFEVEVGLPTVAALLAREAGMQKGSSQPGKEFVGNVSMPQVVKIAKLKMASMGTPDLKKAVKEVIGTCVSMGIKVEGKDPKEVVREVEAGAWDGALEAS